MMMSNQKNNEVLCVVKKNDIVTTKLLLKLESLCMTK